MVAILTQRILLRRMKRSGPKIDPCGTPQVVQGGWFGLPCQMLLINPTSK